MAEIVFDYSSGAPSISTVQLGPDGSAAAPTWSFNTDPDTGIYSNAPDQIQFATGGFKRLSISDNNIFSATTGSYVIQHAAGSDAAPTYSFLGDTDTGIYSNVADTLKFSMGGVNTFNIDPSQFYATTVGGPLIKGIAGTAAFPAYTFNGDTDTGIYSPTADTVSLSIGGVRSYDIDTTSINGRNSGSFQLARATGSATNPTFSFVGDTDTGMYSNTADYVQFSNAGVETSRITSSFISSATTGGYALRHADGTAAGPTYSFNDDTNTGIWASAADTLNIATGGVEALEIDSSQRIGVGGAPDATSILALTSTTLGFLPPRMTTTQRDAITTPTAGLLIYNSTTTSLNYYTSSWQDISGASHPDPHLLGSGTAAAPTYSFSGDTNTGIYNSLADRIDFAAGGTGMCHIDTQYIASETSGSFGLKLAAGSAAAPTYAFQGDLTTGIYSDAGNSISFATGGVFGLIIDSSQNVGIGTTAPLTNLHIVNTTLSLPGAAFTSDKLIIEDTDAVIGLYSSNGGSAGSEIVLGEIDLGALVNSWSILRTTGTTPDFRITFGTNANPFSNGTRVNIDSTGNVGLGTGTAAPAARLDILGTAGFQLRVSDTATDTADKKGYLTTRHYTNAEEDFQLIFGLSNATSNQLLLGGASGVLNAATQISFYTAATTTTLVGTERLRIDLNGNVQSPISGSFYIPSAAGSATNPTYSFSGDTNTGLYNYAADNIGITAGGTERFRINTSYLRGVVTQTPALLAGAASAAFPAYSFVDDYDTGLYNVAADQIGVSLGGTGYYRFLSSDFRSETTGGFYLLRNDGSVTNPTYTFNDDTNTGMWASAADTLNFATGGVEALEIDSSQRIGIGGAPVSTALLALTSTTEGFLPPRMTTTQRDAITTPAAGLVIYNTSTTALNLYTSSWVELASGSGEPAFTAESTPGVTPVATGSDSIAIADGASATGTNSIAFGVSCNSDNTSSIAIGGSSDADGFASIAIGALATARATDAISIGSRADALESVCISIGEDSQAGTTAGNSIETGAIAIGNNTTANKINSICLGSNASATHDYSVAIGRLATSTYGGAMYIKMNNGTVEAQRILAQLYVRTTNATGTVLKGEGEANGFPIASGKAYVFSGRVLARQSGTFNIAAYEFKDGVIENDAGTTTLKVSPTVNILVEDTASWDCTVAANDTNDTLDITVTGVAATNIDWICDLDLVEL